MLFHRVSQPCILLTVLDLSQSYRKNTYIKGSTQINCNEFEVSPSLSHELFLTYCIFLLVYTNIRSLLFTLRLSDLHVYKNESYFSSLAVQRQIRPWISVEASAIKRNDMKSLNYIAIYRWQTIQYLTYRVHHKKASLWNSNQPYSIEFVWKAIWIQ